MSLVVMDDKYRVVLDRDIRATAGLERGDRLIAIPFKGGLILLSLKGKGFKGSLNDFRFEEDAHEASRYLFEGRVTHSSP